MKLDDRTLILLAIQLNVLTLVGLGLTWVKMSAAARVWCIRLTILCALGLAAFSQISFVSRAPVGPVLMIPTQANAVEAVNSRLAKARPSDPAGGYNHDAIQITASQVWGGGLWLGLIWCAFGLLRVRKLRKRSVPFGDCGGLPIRTSEFVGSPMVVGFFRPVLVLPTSMAGSFSADELSSVCAHERAHVSHRDVIWKALHRVCCSVLWPALPLLMTMRTHDRAMEELADAKASMEAQTPEAYASLLVSLAQQRKGRDATFALAMTPKRSNIGRRVRRILAGNAATELRPIRRVFRLGVVVSALAIVGAVLTGFGWQKVKYDTTKYMWQRGSGVLRVQILAPDGSPAKSPEVWLGVRADDGIFLTYLPLQVKDGWVEVDLAAHEPNQILARDANGNVGATYPNGKLEDKLTLISTSTVTGRLVRPDGSPEVGATLSVIACSLRNNEKFYAVPLKDSPIAQTAKSDASGAFTFRGMPRGFIVQIVLNDPSVQQPINSIKNGSSTTYGYQLGDTATSDLGTIQLKEAGMISGRLLLNGKGIAGVRVGAQVINDDMRIPAWGEAVTDKDGSYLIGGLCAARYNVALMMPANLSKDYACAAKDSIKVEEGKTLSGQDLQLVQGGFIEGDVVLKSNADPTHYPIGFYGPDHPESGAWCGSAQCDEKGHFRTRVSPGKYRVYMASGSTTHPDNQEVVVEEGQTARVTLKE